VQPLPSATHRAPEQVATARLYLILKQNLLRDLKIYMSSNFCAAILFVDSVEFN